MFDKFFKKPVLIVKVCRSEHIWQYVVQYSHNYRVVWRSPVRYPDFSGAKYAAKGHVKALKKLGIKAELILSAVPGKKVKVISFA